MNIDQKSIKIIKAKYWKSGWIESNKRVLSSSDTEHLEREGWKLGAVKMSHDNLVKEVIDMSRIVKVEDSASLFSQSLPTRILQDRSFLSTAVQAVKIPEHSHNSAGACPVCGLYKDVNIDQDVMLFEKIMWGGVRLTNIEYVWLDLKLMKCNREYKGGCEALLEFISDLDKTNEKLSASKFAASLKGVKGNKAEREVICGILGICDILIHPCHPGFLEKYRSVVDRELPNQHFIDLEWPFCWYNSSFGVNKHAAEKVVEK